MNPERCRAIAGSGRPCRARAVDPAGLCFLHSADPAWVAKRQEWSQKGGRGKATKARAEREIPPAMAAEELAGWLSKLFHDVRRGEVEPRVGTAAATIAKVLLDVRAATEIEQRLAALEAAAEAQGRGRSRWAG